MSTKTTLDAVDILQNHLKTSVLFTDANKPNGIMTKGNRMQNSKKEDVVLNALTLTNATVQEGIINMNVYVPNLSLPTNPVDNTQVDWKRLKYLAALAVQSIGEVYGEDYNFGLQQIIGPLEDEGSQHYVNLRIEFNAINTQG